MDSQTGNSRRATDTGIVSVCPAFSEENTMNHEKSISDLAYQLWHARGCPDGSSAIDWVEAERQVRGTMPGHRERAPDVQFAPDALVTETPAEHIPTAPVTRATRARKKSKP